MQAVDRQAQPRICRPCRVRDGALGGALLHSRQELPAANSGSRSPATSWCRSSGRASAPSFPPTFPAWRTAKPYPSGTAYELLTALEASKAKGVPDVYVFRKTADAALPTADAERRRQAQIQFDALEAFWSEWFKIEKGQFKAAFQTFASTDAFEQQVELLLRQWLETHGLLGPRMAWPKEKGSPFRGLAPFEAEHAAVFFGRDRVIDEARRRLAAAAERGTPFLLIVGASGVGQILAGARRPDPAADHAGRGGVGRPVAGGANEARRRPGRAARRAGDGAVRAGRIARAGARRLSDRGQRSPTTSRRGGAASAQPILRALERVAEDAQTRASCRPGAEARARAAGRSVRGAVRRRG